MAGRKKKRKAYGQCFTDFSTKKKYSLKKSDASDHFTPRFLIEALNKFMPIYNLRSS
ncbi:hypothetical protein [Bartonella sp. B30(2025)]